MAETTAVMFEHKELVELMLDKQGINEGIWQLQLSLAFGASNLGPNANEMNPAGVVIVQKIGIARVTEETNLTVDASKGISKKNAKSTASSRGKAASTGR